MGIWISDDRILRGDYNDAANAHENISAGNADAESLSCSSIFHIFNILRVEILCLLRMDVIVANSLKLCGIKSDK